MAGAGTRLYTAADLREIMSHVAGWAETWHDVYWYVNTIARHDPTLPESKTVALLEDLQSIQNAPFSTDYRILYELIFGQQCDNCPPPEGSRRVSINYRQLTTKWLNGLVFLATSRDIVFCALGNNVPKDVEDILRSIPDMHYTNYREILERVDAELDRRSANP